MATSSNPQVEINDEEEEDESFVEEVEGGEPYLGLPSPHVPATNIVIKPCKKRCKMCEHIDPKSVTHSEGTFDIQGTYNCTSGNVVYLIRCDKCEKRIHIGETKHELKNVITKNKHDIDAHKEKNCCTSVEHHFSEPEHTMKNLKVSVLQGNFKTEKERKKCKKEMRELLGIKDEEDESCDEDEEDESFVEDEEDESFVEEKKDESFVEEKKDESFVEEKKDESCDEEKKDESFDEEKEDESFDEEGEGGESHLGPSSPHVPVTNNVIKPCKKGCKMCEHIDPSKKVTHSKWALNIPGTYNCTISNVVYLIQCDKCKERIHIGDTGLALRTVMTSLKHTIDAHKEMNCCKPVGHHFSQPDHSKEHLKVSVLKGNFKTDEERRKCKKEMRKRLDIKVDRLTLNGCIQDMSGYRSRIEEMREEMREKMDRLEQDLVKTLDIMNKL